MYISNQIISNIGMVLTFLLVVGIFTALYADIVYFYIKPLRTTHKAVFYSFFLILMSDIVLGVTSLFIPYKIGYVSVTGLASGIIFLAVLITSVCVGAYYEKHGKYQPN